MQQSMALVGCLLPAATTAKKWFKFCFVLENRIEIFKEVRAILYLYLVQFQAENMTTIEKVIK